MQEKYNHTEIESTTQAHWQKTNAYRVVENKDKKKFYCVSMLPYPSGKLHMGHVRNYTINDVMYRYWRMKGYNVLMPMGWDAFGMPAENAAMANGVPPSVWTHDNIAYMKQQMQAMGLAVDWSREIATCQPNYYKWNQWLFLKMLEKGIAYKKTGTVNWDPVDQTVLANEQVIDGCGWRSGALIEKREIPMYYLRISEYADALLSDLENLGWPERVKLMQENWLGKSEGVNFGFPYQIDNEKKWLRVFTTRVDTIMGVTFCAIAAEHPLAQRLSKDNPNIQTFIQSCQQGSIAEADLATAEKKGIGTGFFVEHPFTKEPIEVWIGNYVLMSYGEGAVMGVPAHDERDFAFAKKYGLAIKQVIDLKAEKQTFSTHAWQAWYGEKGNGILINSEQFNDLSFKEAVDAITQELIKLGIGEKRITWRLRDWGISRQRYWGTPIPIIHCDQCGDVPVPETDLPVVLPDNLVPDGTGNPLAKSESFIHCQCPKCGANAKRETDTMDTFVDSAWYFSRYPCFDSEKMVDERTDYWMPMDQYIGGIEHAILHLLYSRFWTKVMHQLGLVSFKEPAANLLTQGMVLNETLYREEASGKKTWFNPLDVTFNHDEKGRPIGALLKSDNQPVILGGIEKMSKSKNNGIDPQSIINAYGADTARLFIIFAAPPEQQLEWSGAGIEGANRFLRRLWGFAYTYRAAIQSGEKVDITLNQKSPLNEMEQTLRREFHTVLGQANFDYQRTHYNTVVSAAMKMLKALESVKIEQNNLTSKSILRECYGILLRVLYPVVPHITSTLWTALNYPKDEGDLLDAKWPTVDESALTLVDIELVLQINGKVRGALKVPKDTSPDDIEAIARAHDIVQKFADGKAIKKVIVVKGRLVNVVL